MASTKLTVTPTTPRLGATISGVDARQPVHPDVIEQMAAAIVEHKVLFLPGQHLSRAQQQAFANQFAPPFHSADLPASDIDEEGLAGLTVVSHFHSDYMFLDEQPAFAMLQMLELPSVGGDTMWADLVSSYEGLSDPVKQLIAPLTAVHAHPDYALDDDLLAQRYLQKYGVPLSPEDLKARRQALRPKERPLVRYLPETGREYYFLSPQHTTGIKELSRDESNAVLGILFKQQLRPEFVIRHRWSVGDIAFWDHRQTLHSGVNDFAGQTRHAERANIGNSRPVRAADALAAA
jgi:taurine dioxygenase